MDKIFQNILEDNLADLVGLTIDASVPVPEHLVNEIISAAIRGNKNISYCRASISRQNRVSVNLKTPLWPWPMDFKLRLEKTVDLSGSPKARARLENHSLLGRLGSLFNALPKGVDIHGSEVVVDIGSFLPKPEQKKYLELIKSMEIKTEEGKLIFDVRIER